MSHPSVEYLTRYFQLTTRIAQMQAGGLTTADSLLQPPFRGNCFNWVLGHIVAGRHFVLELLGQPPLWSAAELALYATDSEPITGGGQALPLARLLADLNETTRRIVEALANSSDDDLTRVLETAHGPVMVLQQIAGRHWHETYHVGQLELLRQLAGKNDKVI